MFVAAHRHAQRVGQQRLQAGHRARLVGQHAGVAQQGAGVDRCAGARALAPQPRQHRPFVEADQLEQDAFQRRRAGPRQRQPAPLARTVEVRHQPVMEDVEKLARVVVAAVAVGQALRAPLHQRGVWRRQGAIGAGQAHERDFQLHAAVRVRAAGVHHIGSREAVSDTAAERHRLGQRIAAGTDFLRIGPRQFQQPHGLEEVERARMAQHMRGGRA
ncbi:conserved hypothetical protein [Ricinus communis]|uniref:Uncharacterized protein n=1 Tax=Ricinus communis TaxID=3988 RepID=B9TK58_RICCO|nr:conserved hypothetical protein [Ricinus communis]